jgi:hypothetical protein
LCNQRRDNGALAGRAPIGYSRWESESEIAALGKVMEAVFAIGAFVLIIIVLNIVEFGRAD